MYRRGSTSSTKSAVVPSSLSRQDLASANSIWYRKLIGRAIDARICKTSSPPPLFRILLIQKKASCKQGLFYFMMIAAAAAASLHALLTDKRAHMQSTRTSFLTLSIYRRTHMSRSKLKGLPESTQMPQQQQHQTVTSTADSHGQQ